MVRFNFFCPKPQFENRGFKNQKINQFLPDQNSLKPQKRFLCIQVRVKYHDPQESNHDTANPWNIQLPAYDDNSTNMLYNDVAEP